MGSGSAALKKKAAAAGALAPNIGSTETRDAATIRFVKLMFVDAGGSSAGEFDVPGAETISSVKDTVSVLGPSFQVFCFRT